MGLLSNAKPWELVYVVTGILVVLYVVLRPLAAAYRLARMIFNLYPDTSRLSAVPLGLSVSRSMGIYDLEDRLFRHLGARRIANLRPLKPLPETITDPDQLAGWTSTGVTASVVSFTNTSTPPELPGWHFRHLQGHSRTRMSADEIDTIVTALGNILAVLRDADPAERPRSTAESASS